MHHSRPSLLKILWTDYPAFFFSSTIVVAWIIILAWLPDWRGDGAIISPNASPIYLSIAVGITLVGAGVLFWRIRLLWDVFLNGAQVRGNILEVKIRRDRGSVKYTYIYNHEEYQASASIHRNQRTIAMKAGNPVFLMVDKRKPNRAFIRDLFL